MAVIRVKRSSEYINAIRVYEVLIDGVSVGTIRNGETKEFPVSAGRHSVVAKIDWCSSPEVVVDVDEGQTVDLKVGGFKYSQVLMPIALGLVVLLLFALEYVIYFVVPVVLLLVYYTTIGKRKYLTLYELN